MLTYTRVILATVLTAGMAITGNAQTAPSVPTNGSPRTEQQQDEHAFLENLKSMTPEQRSAAILAHRQQIHVANEALVSKRQAENLSFIKSKLDGSKDLTDTEKAELRTFFENQYEENMEFREKRFNEMTTFFQEVRNDMTLTKDQRQQQIRDFITKQNAEAKAHQKEQLAAGEAERATLLAERQGADQPATNSP